MGPKIEEGSAEAERSEVTATRLEIWFPSGHIRPLPLT